MPLTITVRTSAELNTEEWAALKALCNAAYEGNLDNYWAVLGPGVHVLGWFEGVLVSHAMWIERTLYYQDRQPLPCAYVELVATDPEQQGRGYATAVLRHLATQITDYTLGALSPSDQGFYARLGWEAWRGPLAFRQAGQLVATPDEELMIFALPQTPSGLDRHGLLSVDWRPGEVW